MNKGQKSSCVHINITIKFIVLLFSKGINFIISYSPKTIRIKQLVVLGVLMTNKHQIAHFD